jgi:hypothetical protein
MVRCSGLVVAYIAVVSFPSALRADPISVTQWSLGVGVNGGFPNIVGAGHNTVTNPFDGELQADLMLSSAVAQFSFAWVPSTGSGSFLTDTDLAAQGPLPGEALLTAGANGGINFHVETDLIFNATIGMDYDLAPGDRESRVSLGLLRLNPNEPLMFIADNALPVFGDPASGELMASGSYVLTPGDYRVQFANTLLSFSGSQSAVSTGTGFVDFSFIPVPTPSALAPLALASVLLRHRRQRRLHR